jgi:hypothetical protein
MEMNSDGRRSAALARIPDLPGARYNDIKQVLEGVLTLFPPAAVDENHLLESLELEFDYLADLLGYEDLEAFVARLIKRYDEE